MNAPEIQVREVADADIARQLFQRRYGAEPPSMPHHVIAFDGSAGRAEIPLCYVHFTPVGEFLLGGGACVDNRAMRQLAPRVRDSIRAMGGLYRMTLDWSIRHFAPSFSAIFGYCGDVLAERIDLAAGFERTGHPHLLVYWTRDVVPAERAGLIAQAQAIGAF